MKDKKDLFDRFKEREHEIQPTPSRHAWDKLEQKLDARKNINQTSKYRSIAQIAAVVAVVSIAAVITLLNTSGSGSSKMVAGTAAKNSTWEEIALEKSGTNDLVTFNENVKAKRVLMNEGTTEKKLVPKVNSGKAAANKIQNYKDQELAGDIDIANNSYEMHKAPLEREVLLGEVTINKNTTIEEIERKAIGKHSSHHSGDRHGGSAKMLDIQGHVTTENELTADADLAVVTKMEMNKNSAMDDGFVEESVVIAPTAPPTESETYAPTSTGTPPQYEITEVNAPAAKTDVSVGDRNPGYFSNRMDNLNPSDRRLEESVAASSAKITKKKRARDIFSRSKNERQSESMVLSSSIGIAANASAIKEKSNNSNAEYSIFAWLTGSWTDKMDATKKEWVSKGNGNMSFVKPSTGSTEFEIVKDGAAIWLNETDANFTYRYNNNPNPAIFKAQNDNREYTVEIIKDSEDQFTIITYNTLIKEEAFMRGLEIVKEDLVERVFVR